MRRALVTLAHPGHAGMLRALSVLDAAAARHGWELRYVLSAPHPEVAASGLDRARTTVLGGLGGWRRWSARARLPATVLRLARLARDADLLYACTLSSFPHTWLAGRLARRPPLVHVYSSYPDARPYRKHWLGRARHVVAPSADSLALARTAVGGFRPGTRARVVYNGMDVDRIERAARAAPPPDLLPDGGPRVGMVGNLDARKNPALLLEAAAAVRATIPGLQVLLVGAFGDPAYEASVRGRIAALGLGDAVTVTGFLANPFPVVRALDVLVHPARRDPFPLALLEGMALARPIVAAAVGGIPEMLVDGESGVLVPADDAAVLARALGELLADPARRARLGAGARRRLSTDFTLERFVTGMFAAFDEAVADGSGVMADVSVVVPTYNRAHTLGESLQSVLGQGGVDLEVIVVDDGSTDDTPALLAAVRDPRLRVIASAHAGIAAARNRGLAAARAPYVAFHDSDDVALPGRLAVPVTYLREHPEVDLVIQNGRMLPPEGEPGAEDPWIRPAVARTLAGAPIRAVEVFRWNLGQLQGMCFTRESLETVGPLDPSFEILDDLDLVLRVTARFTAVFLDVPAFAYRRHPGGVARDREKVREESIRLADKLVRDHPELLAAVGRRAFQRRQARRYARLARLRARAGDRMGARTALAQARALDPLSLRYRWQFLLLKLRSEG